MPQRDRSSPLPARAKPRDHDTPAHLDRAHLRRGLWRHLLVYPPLVAAICDLARASLDPSRRSHAALARLLDAARTRPTRSSPSRERLGAALVAADETGTLLDAIVADLVSLDAGILTGLNLHLAHHPPTSPAFHRYSTTARTRYHALWLTPDPR